MPSLKWHILYHLLFDFFSNSTKKFPPLCRQCHFVSYSVSDKEFFDKIIHRELLLLSMVDTASTVSFKGTSILSSPSVVVGDLLIRRPLQEQKQQLIVEPVKSVRCIMMMIIISTLLHHRHFDLSFTIANIGFSLFSLRLFP